MKKLLCLFFIFLCAFDYPSSPQGRVSDYAGKLTDSQKSALNSKLKGVETKSGHQVAIAMFPNMGGGEIDSFSHKLASTWQIGQKGKNDGVVLVVVLEERKVRIEVGYGLEATLTDGDCNRIIQEVIKPKLKAGDFNGAFEGFIERVDTKLAPPPVETVKPKTAETSYDFPWGGLVGIVLATILCGWYVSYRYDKKQKEREAEEERKRQERIDKVNAEREASARREVEYLKSRPKQSPSVAPSVAKTAAVIGAAVVAGAGASELLESQIRRKRQEDEEREEEERRARRRREEDEESSRRASQASSNDYSSPSPSFDSFSGGGGSFGGGGSSDSF